MTTLTLQQRALSLNPDNWMSVSPSQLSSWDYCEQQWNYGYLQGLSGSNPNSGQEVGTMVHEAANIYYKGGSEQDVDEYFKTLLQAGGLDTLGVEIKRAMRIFRRYMQKWSPEKDFGHKVIASELYFETHIVTNKGYNFYLHGYIDLLTEFMNRLYVWDHKTMGSSKFWSERQVWADFQTLCYNLAMMLMGYEPYGTIVNQFNTTDYKDFGKQPNSHLFHRTTVVRTPLQLRNFQNSVLNRMVNEIVENGENPRRSVYRSCAGCGFFDPCMLAMHGFDTNVMIHQWPRREREAS